MVRTALAFLALILWMQTRTGPDVPERDGVGVEDRLVTGVVVSIPENSADRVQFDFELEQAPLLRARVSWYKERSQQRDIEMPRAAERWQLQLRLRPPHGFANPGGFDYEGQLFREGIGAIGYVRRSADNRRIAPAGWKYPVLQLRAQIVRRIEAAVTDSPGRGILAGLAVGATHGIASEQWRVFAATGITHLIAISGTHVTLIAALAMLLVRLSWRLPWTPRPQRCRSDVAALWGAAVAAVYALLAGFSVPTQRTLVMFLAVLAAAWLRRAQSPSRTLALALIAVLLIDWRAPLAPGF